MNNDFEMLKRSLIENYDMFDNVDAYQTIDTSGYNFRVIFGINVDVNHVETNHEMYTQVANTVGAKFGDSLFIERIKKPLLSEIETLEKKLKELERIKTYIEVEKEIRGTK